MNPHQNLVAFRYRLLDVVDTQHVGRTVSTVHKGLQFDAFLPASPSQLQADWLSRFD
jgi:hypothetical protein